MEQMGTKATAAQSKFEAIVSAIQTGASAMASSFDSMGLGGKMATQMNAAYSAASSGIASLKALFSSTTFSFNQSIALPHFSMSGTFDAQSGTVPTVSVSWYRKAAEYGALFTTPQVVGVGDAADPELLIGEKKLREMLGGDRGSVTFNVTVDGTDNPEMWAARFVREAKQYARIS